MSDAPDLKLVLGVWQQLSSSGGPSLGCDGVGASDELADVHGCVAGYRARILSAVPLAGRLAQALAKLWRD